MPADVKKRVELLANICIVVVTPLLCFFLVKNYLFPSRGPKLPTPVGAHLALPGVDWSQSNQTMLLALSKGCHFCSASAPFYKRLAAEAARAGKVRVLAVLPQERSEASAYLASLGVPVELRQVPLNSIRVALTPTVILVDRQGVAKRAWIGQLPPRKEEELLRFARCGDAMPCE